MRIQDNMRVRIVAISYRARCLRANRPEPVQVRTAILTGIGLGILLVALVLR